MSRRGVRTEWDGERSLPDRERLATLGRLAADLAHEIRNPLTAISMWLFSIREELRPEGDLAHKFDVVDEEIARLGGLLRNFLDCSRPPAAAVRSCCVAEVIDKTLELAGHQVRKKGIRLVREETAGLPPVAADPRQLAQVFLNLLLNAIEATPTGGEIRFRTALECDLGKAAVVVRVRDTGEGIPQEIRARIFQAARTTKENGTGLGLSIAGRIMAEVGGKLVLEDSPPGETSFAVWIPTAEGEGHEPNPGRR